jgi:DNA invertase Pin-like site-specific DNA recombinase
MIIGYARVSTLEQNLNLQMDSLKLMGTQKIFTDKVSSAADSRPGLAKLLSHMKAGDTVVVWRLDRLARNLRQLLDLVARFEEHKVKFKSITEAIDTATPPGRLFLSVFGALAEFERNLIRERTVAGLKSARARGKVGGRPSVLNVEKVKEIHRLFHRKKLEAGEVAQIVGVSRSSVYSALKLAPSIHS